MEEAESEKAKKPRELGREHAGRSWQEGEGENGIPPVSASKQTDALSAPTSRCTSLFVVAIDFGTSYSQIRQVFWGVEHGLKTPKTPTCILFNEKREFRKFGYDAVMKYKSLPCSKAHKWYFFQNFKMNLYGMVCRTALEASNGKTLPALTVFSKSLCYMKEHALSTIQNASFQTVYDHKEVTWVITVPAIWSAAAGLISDMFSEKLIIALEPEAASLWCKQLPQEGFMVDSSDNKKFEDSPGIQYIVVDCGGNIFPVQQVPCFFLTANCVCVCVCVGGTTDITVHEIQENHYLKELHKASGGGWGGNTVDENFKSPYRITTNDISHFFKKVKGAVWQDGTIMITYEKMKSFFAYSTKKIIDTLKEILHKPEMAKVQYVLLVGGFASSVILRDEICEAFSKKYHILCPIETQAAIAKGAVLFGVNPQTVASRVSARTYGIAATQKFDPAIHDLRKWRVSKSGDYVYCDDLFKKLVGIEESVNINEVAHFTFHPTEPDQTSVCFSFYCTEKQDAQYVDEEGLELLGSCRVPMPDTKLGKKRQLKLEIKFGLTEFKATGTDITSNQSQTVMIDFLAV
uniref:Heat shock 70 kDa protein 12A n=1 Tax=Apteryx owenii TaxID=8824 RepID=A0A8B9Q926_APTOW